MVWACYGCLPEGKGQVLLVHFKESKRMMRDRIAEEDYHELARVEAEQRQIAAIDYAHRKVITEMDPAERERMFRGRE